MQHLTRLKFATLSLISLVSLTQRMAHALPGEVTGKQILCHYKNEFAAEARCDMTATDTEANLTNANLQNTDLDSAILTNANLSGANLTHAKLRAEDLAVLNLCGATLPNGSKSQQGC